MWWFPKIGVPQNHAFLDGIFPCKPALLLVDGGFREHLPQHHCHCPKKLYLWWVVRNIFIFFHMLGISSSQLIFILFRGMGKKHQPDIIFPEYLVHQHWSNEPCLF